MVSEAITSINDPHYMIKFWASILDIGLGGGVLGLQSSPWIRT